MQTARVGLPPTIAPVIAPYCGFPNVSDRDLLKYGLRPWVAPSRPEWRDSTTKGNSGLSRSRDGLHPTAAPHHILSLWSRSASGRYLAHRDRCVSDNWKTISRMSNRWGTMWH